MKSQPDGAAVAAAPSGTTARFALLLLTLVTASVYMLQALLAWPGRSQQLACQLAAGYDPNGSPLSGLLLNPQAERWLAACGGGASPLPFVNGAAGTAVVLIAAWLLRAWLPWWKSRPAVPLDAVDSGGQARAALAGLAVEAGLTREPAFLVAPASLGGGAVVFGGPAGRTVRLDAGLLATRAADPARFRAVLLHEFAHIKNNDIDLTYATVALWRCFAVLVLLPYTAAVSASLIAAQFFGWFAAEGAAFWPAARPVLLRQILFSAFLVLLVYLARAGVLRHRELQADADAVAAGADPRVWRDAAAAGGGRTRFLSTHPPWAQRARSLSDPAALFAVPGPQLFLAGAAAMVTAWTIEQAWAALPGVVLAVVPLAWVVVVCACRSALFAAATSARPPRGLRTGLWLGAGLAAGEWLAGLGACDSWFPRDPWALALPFTGGVTFAAWVTGCARLELLRSSGKDTAIALPRLAVATCAVAGAGLWWWMRGGFLYEYGNLLSAAGLRQTIERSFAGPWAGHAFELSIITRFWLQIAVVAGSTGAVVVAVVMWFYPLVLLLAIRPAARGRMPRPRHVWLAGLGGGLVCWAGIAADMAYMHTWQPPPGQRTGAYSLIYAWWLIVAIWAGTLTASFVLAFRRSGTALALVAAAIAELLAVAGVFLADSADGCLGPLRTMGDTCHWVPGAGWSMIKLMTGIAAVATFPAAVAAVIGTAAGYAVARGRRPESSAVSGGGSAASWRVTAAGAVAALAAAAGFALIRPPGGGTPVALDLPPPPEATTVRVAELQLDMWYKVAGQHWTLRLLADYRRFNGLVRSLENERPDRNGQAAVQASVIRSVCAALYDDARTASRALPVPDTALQARWSEMLSATAGDGAACLDDLHHVRDMTAAIEALMLDTSQAAPTLSDIVRRVRQTASYWPDLVHVSPEADHG